MPLHVPHRKYMTEVKALTDPSQTYKFLVKCDCGFEGRAMTQEEADRLKDFHLRRSEARPG